ncbi:hypothetical protein [Algoriphagus taiwanensis]|uniref:Uncharacterized protein n=1 Tax=Algoriphagus taiwanensis TaxID=1445656 RepID=A0ABQ6PVD7_9BACT|nr:hypothetical protein Ataiwa_01960 [Algoriphagus taiwanensis]
MRLEQIVKEYQTEEYKFFKYKDREGNEIKTHFIFETHKDYLDKYLGFYKELDDLTEVIVMASDGIFKLTNQGVQHFIKHNHQEEFIGRDGKKRGISAEISKEVRNNLIKRIQDLVSSNSFDQIFEIVSSCKVKGFGELSIYDTSLRISSFLNLEPDKVYLHAGARKGIEILEKKGYVRPGISQQKWVEMSDLPEETHVLSPKEAEHFYCSKKEELELLNPKITI